MADVHAGYMAELEALAVMHRRKAADYGIRGGDPIANLRASASLGVEPWRAVLVRAGDKWSRIQSYLLNGELANESFEDSLRDMASYLLLAKVLREEI